MVDLDVRNKKMQLNLCIYSFVKTLRQSASRLWASNVTALLIFYQKPAGKLKKHSEKYTFLMK